MFTRIFFAGLIVLTILVSPLANIGVQAQIVRPTPKPPLDDVLFKLRGPKSVANWTSENIKYDWELSAEDIGCLTRSPEEIYRSSLALCSEFARLVCYWATLHNTACYQVAFATTDYAHAIAWLPEYRATIQTPGTVNYYDSYDISEIIDYEAYNQPVCYVVLESGSVDSCIYNCYLKGNTQ